MFRIALDSAKVGLRRCKLKKNMPVLRSVDGFNYWTNLKVLWNTPSVCMSFRSFFSGTAFKNFMCFVFGIKAVLFFVLSSINTKNWLAWIFRENSCFKRFVPNGIEMGLECFATFIKSLCMELFWFFVWSRSSAKA